jgi:hypothetical protein
MYHFTDKDSWNVSKKKAEKYHSEVAEVTQIPRNLLYKFENIL